MTEQNTTVAAYAGEIIEYSPTDAALTELREKFANVIFPVDTPKGMKDAKEVRQKLVKLRTGLEAKRKEIKEPALRRTQAIDAEARSITAAIKAIEEPIDAQIKAEENRIEAEKQAKAAREAEIKEKIAGIRNLPLALAHAPADEIAAEKEALEAFTPPEEVFGEFTEDCKAALTEAIAALADLLEKAAAREEAAAAVAAEQARLDAERRALEEERAAYEAEKAAFEARKAAEAAQLAETPAPAPDAEPLVLTGAETEPAAEEITTEVMPEVIVTPEQAAAIFKDADEALDNQEPLVVTDWTIRSFAMATAEQFHALSLKVAIVGFVEFAQELEAVADALRSGQLDAVLAAVDREAIIASDTNLLDATVNAIDALTEEAKVAA